MLITQPTKPLRNTLSGPSIERLTRNLYANLEQTSSQTPADQGPDKARSQYLNKSFWTLCPVVSSVAVSSWFLQNQLCEESHCVFADTTSTQTLLTMAVRRNEKEKFPTTKVAKIALTTGSPDVIDMEEKPYSKKDFTKLLFFWLDLCFVFHWVLATVK